MPSIYDGPASASPAAAVTAYCAPGLRDYAATLLALNGEQAGRIIEHPYLKGRTDIILTTDPDWPASHA